MLLTVLLTQGCKGVAWCQKYFVSSCSCLVWQENCSACSQVPQDLQFPPSAKLQEVLEYLTENASLWVHLLVTRLTDWYWCLSCLHTVEAVFFLALLKGVIVKLALLAFIFSRQMKSPAITATLEGKNKTLYLQTVASIEERTRPNLCKTLKGKMFFSSNMCMVDYINLCLFRPSCTCNVVVLQNWDCLMDRN